MLAAVLRAGNKHAGYGSVGILRRIVSLLRASFPMCKFVLHGDAGYALPALYDWREQEYIDYAISLSGYVKNRVKELKNDLLSGQTSRHLFMANQFHLLQHAAAFVLLQALQTIITRIGRPRWQAGTVRVKLLKVTALVIESVRRVLIKLPNSYPLQPLHAAAGRLAGEWQGGRT